MSLLQRDVFKWKNDERKLNNGARVLLDEMHVL
jgi:hypothetical protein